MMDWASAPSGHGPLGPAPLEACKNGWVSATPLPSEICPVLPGAKLKEKELAAGLTNMLVSFNNKSISKMTEKGPPFKI